MGRWFLVYCKPGQDVRAEANLLRQGFEVYRPTINIVKNKIGCKSSLKRVSLFPRYVFIHADSEKQSLSPVSSTSGVANFVRFGDVYATAPNELIEQIKAKAEQQFTLQESNNTLRQGDEILIDGHGFDQVKAIYCNPCGKSRAMILITILGKESRLSVPKNCVTKMASLGT